MIFTREQARRRGGVVRSAVLLLFLGGALGAVVAGATAVPARAEPPVTLGSSDIADPDDILSPAEEAEVQEALDRLDDGEVQLFAAYVDSFDGTDPVAWANASAENSGLGANDLLLAVAVDDRQYALAVHDETPLSDSRVDDIERAAESALRDDDWPGAAVAAADAVPGTASGGGTGLLVGGVAVAAVAGGLYLFSRRRRAAQQQGRDDDVVGHDRGTTPPAAPELTLDQLDKRAAAELVDIDDALRTSEQELGFAQAEFGLEATRTFQAALDRARADAQQAFTIRKELDDEIPETEPQRRHLLGEVITLTERAADTLDEQSAAFEKLRNMTRRAPELLEETAQRCAEVRERVPVARQELSTLSTTWPAAALASVTRNPDQSEALLKNALEAVAKGRDAHAAGNDSIAVAHVRGAQNALGQAVRLLDAVHDAGTTLAEAGPRLHRAIASVTGDLADAERLAPEAGTVTAAVREAQEALADARAATPSPGTAGGDPLAALSRLGTAESELDAALAPFREQAETRARVAGRLSDAVARADAAIRAADEYIETRRGAVGARPRTLLAEAIRQLGDARRLGRDDPERALAAATQADRSASGALSLARQEAEDALDDDWMPGGFAGGGRYGRSGAYGRRGGGGSGLGSVLTGMVLGGILSGGGGGGGGGLGGGFGGGSGGGGFGGGSRGGRF
ncbi:TPM domain-containing protein [Myceligenerans crystallogenes]|uniref:TPM domain-containing protein n=1 Tax=Myceligenerans crystallogenes TaxID=316335 RepID=A0ABN2N7Z9_9MICO